MWSKWGRGLGASATVMCLVCLIAFTVTSFFHIDVKRARPEVLLVICGLISGLALGWLGGRRWVAVVGIMIVPVISMAVFFTWLSARFHEVGVVGNAIGVTYLGVLAGIGGVVGVQLALTSRKVIGRVRAAGEGRIAK